MPIKIKISLTIYIILVSLAVIFYEKNFGQADLIYTLIFVTLLMITGIWIFPEVVTKKTTSNDDEGEEKRNINSD
tara:strand:+ start:2567 stop:2791 length:225 start_codon:yes stop_codon:yes gene_type:complete